MDLDALINAYRGPLIGMLAAWGAPWADAAEIAQDSFCEAWLNRESCRGDWQEPEVFARWLRGVAHNQYRNWARGRGRRQARILTLAPDKLEQVAAPTDRQSSDHLDELRLAIQRLPAKQREVVLMHYLEETSVNETAALLSITVKAVEGRLYQARRTLRRLLDSKPASSQIRKLLLCL